MAARMAEKYGYKNIKVYHAGVPAWSQAGNILLTTYDFVSTRLGYIVTIDTRAPDAAEKGHIQGAVAIRLEDVAREKNQFPLDRKAYIVFYDQETNMEGLAPVVKEVARWGYNNLYVFNGGYSGWLKKNGLTQSGMVRTQIFYLPRPHPGEIVGDEFMNIVNNKPQDKLILDVRTQAEAALGMIEGAVNIPVDELQGRLKELPEGQGDRHALSDRVCGPRWATRSSGTADSRPGS